MRRYTVLLTRDTEDGGYTVSVPALPGCYTQGDNREQALERAREAIEAYLLSIEARGEPVPEEDATPLLATVEV